MAQTNACLYVQRGIAVFFEYDTPKIVHIKSKSIGIFNRLVQLAIIGYIIGWVFIYKKGYQLEDVGVSGTTTKVKGVAYTKDPRVGNQKLWDSTDIVVPAEENNAFFVMTNMIITNDQSPSECAESPTVPGANCTEDKDCLPINKPFLLGHGVTTGVCNKTTKTCMVEAWCPIEHDKLPTRYPVLNATKTFTVLIKNHVYFPYYKKTRSNIVESTNASYLQGCNYDAANDPFCPVFRLGYIVDHAQQQMEKKQTYDDMAYEGGVVSIRISWDCNFDYDPLLCKPKYSFDRLDKGEDSLIAKGYNYRFSHNYFQNDVQKRQLIKAYGILFIITMDARAAAFNVIPTLQNIGSGLALLSIATIVCDVFVLYLHKKRKFFRSHKYEEVTNTDAFSIMEADDEDM